jgi:CO dehydrogenase maturation factor
MVKALLHGVVYALELREGEIVLMDTQGGLEHFGRALTDGFDQGIIVTEPTYNAVSIARRCMLLSRELGVRHLHLVMNKVRGRIEGTPAERLTGECGYCDSIITLPFDDRIAFGAQGVDSLFRVKSEFADGLKRLQLAIRQAGVRRRCSHLPERLSTRVQFDRP